MNEQYEKWLDERLKKIVDSGKVEFDSEQWKQKYAGAYQALVSRACKRPSVLRFIWGRPLVRVAAGIAIAVIVVFFTLHQPEKRSKPTIVTKPEQSPAVMMSRLSLMLAYNRGGLDAVDKQCEKVFKLLGQKNTKLSIDELLNENNGKEPERKDL
jgi:hypothetical protein